MALSSQICRVPSNRWRQHCGSSKQQHVSSLSATSPSVPLLCLPLYYPLVSSLSASFSSPTLLFSCHSIPPLTLSPSQSQSKETSCHLFFSQPNSVIAIPASVSPLLSHLPRVMVFSLSLSCSSTLLSVLKVSRDLDIFFCPCF